MSKTRGRERTPIVQRRSMEPDIRRVLDRCVKGRDFGEVVTYSELERVTGLSRERDEPRLRALIGKVKRRALVELRRCLRARPNEGYEILSPQEQVRQGVRVFGQATKRIAVSATMVTETERSRLGAAESAAADWIAANMRSIESILRRNALVYRKAAETQELPALEEAAAAS